jgi:hypothetical protein
MTRKAHIHFSPIDADSEALDHHTGGNPHSLGGSADYLGEGGAAEMSAEGAELLLELERASRLAERGGRR